jgi:hypothetical protein
MSDFSSSLVPPMAKRKKPSASDSNLRLCKCSKTCGTNGAWISKSAYYRHNPSKRKPTFSGVSVSLSTGSGSRRENDSGDESGSENTMYIDPIPSGSQDSTPVSQYIMVVFTHLYLDIPRKHLALIQTRLPVQTGQLNIWPALIIR